MSERSVFFAAKMSLNCTERSGHFEPTANRRPFTRGARSCSLWDMLAGVHSLSDRFELAATLVPRGEACKVQATFVYFIACGDRGAIKVGVATDVTRRVAELQTGSADELILLAYTPGGFALESGIHDQFSADRIRGEWFRDTPELRAYIAKLVGA